MTRSRRDVLRMGGASVAAALTGGFAGCSSISESLPGGGGGDGGGSSGLSGVPAGVSAVARGDVTKTLNDSAITQFTNAVLDMAAQNESYTGPTDKQGLLDRFSQRTGLDPSAASTATGYLKYPNPETPSSQQYSALRFEAGWSEDALVSAFEDNDYALKKGSYSGHAIYQPGGQYQTIWMGVVGSNAYVVGTESAVKETIDVAEGNVESLGGDLKSAYSSVRSAPFRFASAVPEQQLPSESAQVGGSTIAVDQLAAVNHVAGATYHDGDTVGIVVRMLTGGQSDAEDVRNIVAGALSAAEGMKINETISKALDEVSVSQDGSTVVAKVSGSVERATRLIEVVVGQFVYGQQAADVAQQ